MSEKVYNSLTNKQKEKYSLDFVKNVVKALIDWVDQTGVLEDNQIRQVHSWVEDYLGEGGFESKINTKDLKDMIKAFKE